MQLLILFSKNSRKKINWDSSSTPYCVSKKENDTFVQTILCSVLLLLLFSCFIY